MSELSGIDYVVSYLQSRRPDAAELAPDYDLIEHRVLDSLGFLEFLYLLEEHTGRTIPLETVAPGDFRTIATIRARFFEDPIKEHDHAALKR